VTNVTNNESDKCQKERERRRKKYKLVLVRWKAWDSEQYVVEYKADIVWKEQFMGVPEVICDDQPERVLKGMLKLLKEDK
jgi:hypothetical protein